MRSSLRKAVQAVRASASSYSAYAAGATLVAGAAIGGVVLTDAAPAGTHIDQFGNVMGPRIYPRSLVKVRVGRRTRGGARGAGFTHAFEPCV